MLDNFRTWFENKEVSLLQSKVVLSICLKNIDCHPRFHPSDPGLEVLYLLSLSVLFTIFSKIGSPLTLGDSGDF